MTETVVQQPPRAKRASEEKAITKTFSTADWGIHEPKTTHKAKRDIAARMTILTI
jgi:hypothetical protein